MTSTTRAAAAPAATAPQAAPERRGGQAAARRRARQGDIVASTRKLFDERGSRSANIDDIAKSVGINRAIIYRHFASKEELFALTLADYLVELDGELDRADRAGAAPAARLGAVSDVFARYCLRYPAFVDCALALLGRPGSELLDEVGEVALMQLTRLMAGELGRIADIVIAGRSTARAAGQTDAAPATADERLAADLLANALYMQVLGVMHLARNGFIVRSAASGGTQLAGVDPEQIIELVRRMALSVASTSEATTP